MLLLIVWSTGDIGTSPLYVYSTVFQEPPTPEDVLCAASLVFWAITLIVLGKYVFIVMLADDNGEGARRFSSATACVQCFLNPSRFDVCGTELG